MPNRPCLALLAGILLTAPVLSAEPSARARLGGFFTGWYPRIPGTHFEAEETRTVSVPGFTAFLVSRRPDPAAPAPLREESSVTLYDGRKDEVFAGHVLHDASRVAARRPFDAPADLPNMEASLREVFGVPVRIERRGEARGVLLPITIGVEQAPGAFVALPGYVSADGATLLLGEFHALSEKAEAWRRKVLSENPGVRVGSGAFTVVAFLDFQCERCKRRTPEARAAAAQRGGAVEAHFLPLVQGHEWAFAAAESAAALARIAPALYARYEEMVFARSEGMTAAAARELAADVAEAAGAREKLDAEFSSGRARDRVLRDVLLAARVGVTGTPAFLLDGRLLPGERSFLENELSRRPPR
ncbi:MAG: thioredoxin domain-containing protein [Acidobacteriota bacterium]